MASALITFWTWQPLGRDFSEENTLEAVGIEPWRLEVPAVIGEVSDDSPADPGRAVQRRPYREDCR